MNFLTFVIRLLKSKSSIVCIFMKESERIPRQLLPLYICLAHQGISHLISCELGEGGGSDYAGGGQVKPETLMKLVRRNVIYAAEY